uniref:dCMP deaminase n=1 Tax=Panagrellus redivivus TaxID=6233 RepID=A0A7E4W0L5_PANRE
MFSRPAPASAIAVSTVLHRAVRPLPSLPPSGPSNSLVQSAFFARCFLDLQPPPAVCNRGSLTCVRHLISNHRFHPSVRHGTKHLLGRSKYAIFASLQRISAYFVPMAPHSTPEKAKLTNASSYHQTPSEEGCMTPEEAAEVLKRSKLEDGIPSFNQKREDCLTWDEMHMGHALLAAMRSKDPVTQVGAVIVDADNIVKGMGYNGLPRGCDDNDFPWGKHPRELFSKHSFVCHAEENAILNASGSLKGNTLFATHFPCHRCTKMIIQKGIAEVVYIYAKPDEDTMIASKAMLFHAGVKIRKFQSSRKSITINFG